jgi:spore germination cell wall hydrolase CwlJ-like protein
MISPEDIDIAAKTVWGEARGEGELGMQAVANVIVNRWKREDGQFRKDDTLANTCRRKFQFSCWLPADPNLDKMARLNYADKLYRRAVVAVLEAIDMLPDADITHGATHYCTLDLTPFWAEGKTPCATIYHHKFFKDIA